MIRYVDTVVTFSEVPDEISLCINISNCPCHCEGCHSTYLAEDIGDNLNDSTLNNLIDNNKGITCVCFMGGDANPRYINHLASIIKENYPELKVTWYSGRQELSKDINLANFDFIKLGPYIKEKGPLNKRTTNQIFYKVFHFSSGKSKLIDITYKFWKN